MIRKAKGVHEKLDDFSMVGVKPRFIHHKEEGKGFALARYF